MFMWLKNRPENNFRSFLLALFLAVSLLMVRQLTAAVATEAVEAERQSSRMVNEFRREAAAVRPWFDQYGTIAVFAAIFLEGIGIPAPGLTLFIVATMELTSNEGSHLSVLLLGAFLSATLGNSLGYAAGHFGGRRLLRRLRVEESRLEPLNRGFRKYGGWLILMARFVDGLKQLNGIAAGVFAMPWKTFALFNAIGAALWVSFFGLGTCYIEAHVGSARIFLRQLNPWVACGLGVVLMVVLWWLFGLGHRERRTP